MWHTNHTVFNTVQQVPQRGSRGLQGPKQDGQSGSWGSQPLPETSSCLLRPHRTAALGLQGFAADAPGCPGAPGTALEIARVASEATWSSEVCYCSSLRAGPTWVLVLGRNRKHHCNVKSDKENAGARGGSVASWERRPGSRELNCNRVSVPGCVTCSKCLTLSDPVFASANWC